MATTSAYASTGLVSQATAPAVADATLPPAAANAATLAWTVASTGGVTNTTTIAGAAGAKIEELVVVSLGLTVAGLVNVFAWDGSAGNAGFFALDSITVPTPAWTAAGAVELGRSARRYTNLELPTGWGIRFSVNVTGNQSLLKLLAFGGQF